MVLPGLAEGISGSSVLFVLGCALGVWRSLCCTELCYGPLWRTIKYLFVTVRQRDRSTALILNYFDYRLGEILTRRNVKLRV